MSELEKAMGLQHDCRLVLEISHATNVPKMDIGSESDVFCEAWVDSGFRSKLGGTSSWRTSQDVPELLRFPR